MSGPLVNWIGRQSSGLPDANGIAGAGVSMSSAEAEIAQAARLLDRVVYGPAEAGERHYFLASQDTLGSLRPGERRLNLVAESPPRLPSSSFGEQRL